MQPNGDPLAAAMAHHRAGRLREAGAGYRHILATSPQSADAWHLSGVLATQEGRLQEAVEQIERALCLVGPQPTVLFNLAQALRKANDRAGAIARLEEVIRIAPKMVAAHETLAELYRECGRIDRAIEHLAQVVALVPENWQALNNLGSLWAQQNDWLRAAAAFAAACRLNPPGAEPFFNLATAERRLRRLPAAVAAARQALARSPEMPVALQLLGDLQADAGDTSQAAASYRRVQRRQPRDLASALRSELVAPLVFENNAHIDDWRETLAARLPIFHDARWQLECETLAASGIKPPLAWIYQGRDDLPLKRQFAEIFRRRIPPWEIPRGSGGLHAGFVVTGGNEGVFIRGMAEVINRLQTRRLRVTLVCSGSGRDRLQRAVTRASVEYFPLPPALPDAARAIASARFDLLYYWEIGTDSLNYFLPFFHLAPVQCASWGWPVTSGIDTVDEFLSSELLEPTNAARHYSERLVCMDLLPNCYGRPPSFPPLPRERWGLAAGERLYLCPQNPRKLHPDFDQLAAAVLRRDPRGRLLLIEGTRAAVSRQLRRRWSVTMPDCAARIQFVPRLTQDAYRALLASADVVMDSVHYGGGANSVYDALAAGTPLVTLPGEFHRGRYASGVYRRLGLDDLVAMDSAHFVRQAVQLAGDRQFRDHWQRRVAERLPALFDDGESVQQFEHYLLAAIERGR